WSSDVCSSDLPSSELVPAGLLDGPGSAVEQVLDLGDLLRGLLLLLQVLLPGGLDVLADLTQLVGDDLGVLAVLLGQLAEDVSRLAAPLGQHRLEVGLELVDGVLDVGADFLDLARGLLHQLRIGTETAHSG